MQKIKILIVEDQAIIAKDLSYMLEDLSYVVDGICHNSEDCFKHLNTHRPDLIMLDINLEEERNGIDIAEIVNKKYKIPFIFLTSYSDPSTIEKAKITRPLAYLIKPIDEKDLISTLEVAIYNLSHKDDKQDFHPDFLFIRDGISHVKVNVTDIIYAEAHDNYTFIHTIQKKYLLSSTLKVIQHKLSSFPFFRIHRSYLINMDHVCKIEEGYVYLTKDNLPIGKTYKNEFIKNFKFL